MIGKDRLQRAATIGKIITTPSQVYQKKFSSSGRDLPCYTRDRAEKQRGDRKRIGMEVELEPGADIEERI